MNTSKNREEPTRESYQSPLKERDRTEIHRGMMLKLVTKFKLKFQWRTVVLSQVANLRCFDTQEPYSLKEETDLTGFYAGIPNQSTFQELENIPTPVSFSPKTKKVMQSERKYLILQNPTSKKKLGTNPLVFSLSASRIHEWLVILNDTLPKLPIIFHPVTSSPPISSQTETETGASGTISQARGATPTKVVTPSGRGGMVSQTGGEEPQLGMLSGEMWRSPQMGLSPVRASSQAVLSVRGLSPGGTASTKPWKDSQPLGEPWRTASNTDTSTSTNPRVILQSPRPLLNKPRLLPVPPLPEIPDLPTLPNVPALPEELALKVTSHEFPESLFDLELSMPPLDHPELPTDFHPQEICLHEFLIFSDPVSVPPDTKDDSITTSILCLPPLPPSPLDLLQTPPSILYPTSPPPTSNSLSIPSPGEVPVYTRSLSSPNKKKNQKLSRNVTPERSSHHSRKSDWESEKVEEGDQVKSRAMRTKALRRESPNISKNAGVQLKKAKKARNCYTSLDPSKWGPEFSGINEIPFSAITLLYYLYLPYCSLVGIEETFPDLVPEIPFQPSTRYMAHMERKHERDKNFVGNVEKLSQEFKFWSEDDNLSSSGKSYKKFSKTLKLTRIGKNNNRNTASKSPRGFLNTITTWPAGNSPKREKEASVEGLEGEEDQGGSGVVKNRRTAEGEGKSVISSVRIPSYQVISDQEDNSKYSSTKYSASRKVKSGLINKSLVED